MSALAGLVKPLEWQNIGRCVGWQIENETHHLHTAVGFDRFYEVARGKVGWWTKWKGAYHAQELATADAAKAAAQAEYEARILSALHLPLIAQLSEDASKAAELARALQVVAAVLQSEITRSGGQPFTGRWSIPSIDWRGTVPEALDLADAALDAKP